MGRGQGGGGRGGGGKGGGGGMSVEQAKSLAKQQTALAGERAKLMIEEINTGVNNQARMEAITRRIEAGRVRLRDGGYFQWGGGYLYRSRPEGFGDLVE